MIGQGAFGPVYRAQMTAGEAVAVKVLATDSKQGEKEFQTEVAIKHITFTSLLYVWNRVPLVGLCFRHSEIFGYNDEASDKLFLQELMLA